MTVLDLPGFISFFIELYRAYINAKMQQVRCFIK